MRNIFNNIVEYKYTNIEYPALAIPDYYYIPKIDLNTAAQAFPYIDKL
jgi:hypothetical protein